MQLHSPVTYSLQAYPGMPDYPTLGRDLRTEVLVMGTGISGALTAWALQ
ncbi:MAG: FAD-binding oxidoreductase, partial [Sphingobacteriales bacterium]